MENADKGFAVLKDSPIHGKGLFAGRTLEPGEKVIEFAGKIGRWADYKDSRSDYACLMGLEYGRVIDPRIGGNNARYIIIAATLIVKRSL